MDNIEVLVHCHFNGFFQEDGGNVKYVGGSCRLAFIGQGESFNSLRARVFKFMNISPGSCKIEIKLCYSGEIGRLIDIVDNDDVRNISRLYKSHAFLMELYAVSNIVERKVSTCDLNEIDEVLMDERLELLISCRSAEPSMPQPPNFELVGSFYHPILIDDADATNSDGGIFIADMKGETDSDDSIRIVASSSEEFHWTYNAMDVVSLRQSNVVGLTAEQFDDDDNCAMLCRRLPMENKRASCTITYTNGG